MSQDESATSTGPISGLIGSLRGALATLVAIAHTRLEIFSTELREEVGRAATLLLWAFIALLAAGIGLLLGALLLVIIFWDTHRVLVATLVTAFFFLLTLAAVLLLRAKLKAHPKLFEATLGEFASDREHLERES